MPANEQRVKAAYEAWCKPRANRIELDHPRDAFAAGYEAALTDAAPRMGEAEGPHCVTCGAEHDCEVIAIVRAVDASATMPATTHPDCDGVKLIDVADWNRLRAAILPATPAAPRGGVTENDRAELLRLTSELRQKVDEAFSDEALAKRLYGTHPDTAPAGVRELVAGIDRVANDLLREDDEAPSGYALACELLDIASSLRLAAMPDGREDGVPPREGDEFFRGLYDGQWVNIVNHADCYRDFTKEEAVAHAVKLTYAALRENNTRFPPVAQERGQVDKVSWAQLGDWYNTLCHGSMYLSEGDKGNAAHAFDMVIRTLEDLRNKHGDTESFRSLAEKEYRLAAAADGERA